MLYGDKRPNSQRVRWYNERRCWWRCNHVWKLLRLLQLPPWLWLSPTSTQVRVQTNRIIKCLPNHKPTQNRNIQSPTVYRYECLYKTREDAPVKRMVHIHNASSICRWRVVARYGRCRSNIFERRWKGLLVTRFEFGMICFCLLDWMFGQQQLEGIGMILMLIGFHVHRCLATFTSDIVLVWYGQVLRPRTGVPSSTTGLINVQCLYCRL